MTHRQKQWLVRILIGGLIGIAALVPVGGLFNDLVSGGLLAMGNHTPFRLVSYGVSREVPCSVLKCETVLGTLDATPKFP